MNRNTNFQWIMRPALKVTGKSMPFLQEEFQWDWYAERIREPINKSDVLNIFIHKTFLECSLYFLLILYSIVVLS